MEYKKEIVNLRNCLVQEFCPVIAKLDYYYRDSLNCQAHSFYLQIYTRA